MEKDSKLIGIMFPIALADALERRFGAKKQDFIREAVAEKFARDFGEKISPILERKNQGRRNDLARIRDAFAGIESAAAGAGKDLPKLAEKAEKLAKKARKKTRSI